MLIAGVPVTVGVVVLLLVLKVAKVAANDVVMTLAMSSVTSTG